MAPPLIVTVTLNPSLDEWIHLPRLRLGELNRADAFARYAGGKGINVSRVVHELGGRTVALGFMGGHDGVILRNRLDALGIRHEMVPVPGMTRNNYKILTDHPAVVTEVNTPGPRIAPAQRRAMDRALTAWARRAAAVVCSGSLPPGVPSGIYGQWMRRLGRRGVMTVLDGSGDAFRNGLAGRPWLVKPNRREAEEVLGRRLTTTRQVIDAVRRLTRRGPQVVVVSLGEGGAVMGTAAERTVWIAEAPRVTTRSTVGAGDSLVAGFVTGWLRTKSLEQALRLGIACGTATVMTPGTELCRAADVKRLLPRVRVRRL